MTVSVTVTYGRPGDIAAVVLSENPNCKGLHGIKLSADHVHNDACATVQFSTPETFIAFADKIAAYADKLRAADGAP